MVPTDVLTPEAILEATEGVLRRHGPAKATVLDVARVLGVSHGSVYRHFGSKAALRGAVLRRWLERAHVALPGIATSDEESVARLRRWLRELFDAKRAKALDDPELFATYEVLVGEQADVIAEHLDELVGQLERIVGDGAATGAFTAPDPRRTARAVFHATSRFHHPGYAAAWAAPGADDDFDALVALVLDGLVQRDAPPAAPAAPAV
jgi:AcrR family transcriptional regulator